MREVKEYDKISKEVTQIELEEAIRGEWGAKDVLVSNVQHTIAPRQQVGMIRERLLKMYAAQTNPPECYVAQMAFTLHNTFLLTTDGRIFSWGGNTFCLGRTVHIAN